MSELILQIQYGGLGDHLFYSHIPRIAKETGTFSRVYISNKSEFRHPDYKKLIWDQNPYIDGFVDREGLYPIFEKLEPNENLLDRIMLLLGIEDGKRFHEPELYFKPKLRNDLAGKVVYDPNFVSYVGDIQNGKSVGKWMKQNGTSIDYQMKIRGKNLGVSVPNQVLETPTLEEFCSVLISCGELYCLTSGTATLAAALGKKATAFYANGQNKMFHHSLLHRYVDVSPEKTFIEKIKALLK